jgi:hypothetical protein
MNHLLRSDAPTRKWPELNPLKFRTDLLNALKVKDTATELRNQALNDFASPLPGLDYLKDRGNNVFFHPKYRCRPKYQFKSNDIRWLRENMADEYKKWMRILLENGIYENRVGDVSKTIESMTDKVQKVYRSFMFNIDLELFIIRQNMVKDDQYLVRVGGRHN